MLVWVCTRNLWIRLRVYV